MLKHLPGASPAPDRAALPATESHTAKHALLGWLSDFRQEPFPRASRVRRRVLLPVVAAALISTTTMAACGSEEASPAPSDDQPAAVSTANQGQEQSSDQARSRESERPTAENGSDSHSGQQASARTETPTTSNAAAEPTNTARPTPDNRPDATATPEPTPTVVPTATPDPIDVLFGAQRGYETFSPHFYNLHSYNQDRLRIALSEPAADFVKREYPESTSYSRGNLITLAHAHLGDMEWERIPSEPDEIHVRILFHLYWDPVPLETVIHEVTVDVAMEMVETPFRTSRQELSTHAPVFSHFLNQPTFGPGEKQ